MDKSRSIFGGFGSRSSIKLKTQNFVSNNFNFTKSTTLIDSNITSIPCSVNFNKIDEHSMESINSIHAVKLKNSIKIWSRQSIILPHLIGKIVHIHNGQRFMPIRIIQEMVGHKFGEFSLTRKKNQRQGIKK